MPLFSDKLGTLHRTAELVERADFLPLVNALRDGFGRLSIAVGSGGSAVAAEFLRTCRNSLQGGPTMVQTPLEFVVGGEDIRRAQTWLFSARGENADVLAAFDSARTRGTRDTHVVTSNPDGALAERVRASGFGVVHLVPVFDPKDGFLATHSLVATTAALLLASDAAVAGRAEARSAGALHVELAARLETARARRHPRARSTDTMILLVDPRLSALGVLLETFLWEAALCPVQRTDFRNFAHGRHVWLARRPHEAAMLALVGDQVQEIWSGIDASLPDSITRQVWTYGACGRGEVFLSLIDGLSFVDVFGTGLGIDPGKPGAGPFARPIYDERGLESLSIRLSPGLRLKRRQVDALDPPDHRLSDLETGEEVVRQRLAAARFGGLVLDFDGTVVANEARLKPPRPSIVAELVRLLDDGVRLGFATGRGGSIGETLRDQIPAHHHEGVIIGYYNGAYLRPLSVDIRQEPPPSHPAIAEAVAWTRRHQNLFRLYNVKDSRVQMSVDLGDLQNPTEFVDGLRDYLEHSGLPLEIRRSQHSFDVVLADTCKTAVVSHFAHDLGDARKILCIGDSGALGGNDHTLLGLPYGLSVGEVCDRRDVGWSFFGAMATGPDALEPILRSLIAAEGGGMRLDVSRLGLVTRGENANNARMNGGVAS